MVHDDFRFVPFPYSSGVETTAKVGNRFSAANKFSNITAHTSFEVMQLVLHAFRDWHQGCLKLGEYPFKVVQIRYQARPTNFCLPHRDQNRSELRRKVGHLDRQKAPQNASRALPKRNGFFMLLAGDSRRLIRYFRGSLRCSMSRDSHHGCCDGCTNSDHNSGPVRHVSPIYRKRAYRHRHFPLSMMEPILP